MDDITFQIKNVEFHLKQVSQNYDKCISKAVKKFVESNLEFSKLVKPCESLKLNLSELMKQYEQLNSNRLEN
jgi:hypothetical protein